MVGLVAIAALAVSASGSSSGSLKQLSGKNGCVHTGPPLAPCKSGRFLDEVSSVATSNDGRFVYIASPTDDDGGSVASFSRNTKTGKLTQLSGKTGCSSNDKADGKGGFTCAMGKGLVGARDLALSPDQRFLYVAGGGHAIAIFERSRKSGRLKQSSGPKTPPCLSDGADPQCKTITPSLSDARGISFTPDGKSVFVAAAGGNVVLAFKRSQKTGALRLRSGKAGCFSAVATPGCKTTRALVEPNDLVVGPGGKQLYVASSEGSDLGSTDAAGAVVTFNISRKGKLHQPSGKAGCISADIPSCDSGKALHDANAISASRDGKAVYVASQGDGGFGESMIGSVAAFSRKSSGRLRQLGGKAGCTSQNGSDGTTQTPGSVCRKGRALFEPSGLLVAPNSKTVYVANGDPPASIDVFSRGKHGAKLHQLSGKAGCLSGDGSDGFNPTCKKARGVEGALTVGISPPKGGKHCQTLYVAAQDSAGAYPLGGAIAAFNVRGTGCKG